MNAKTAARSLNEFFVEIPTYGIYEYSAVGWKTTFDVFVRCFVWKRLAQFAVVDSVQPAKMRDWVKRKRRATSTSNWAQCCPDKTQHENVVMWTCVRVVKEAKHCALLLTCDHLIEDDGDGISKKKTSRLLMQARNLAEDFLTLYHLMRQMVFEYLTQHFDIPRPKGFADPSPSPSPMLSLMENRIPRKNDDSLLWPHHCYSDMSRQLEAFVINLTLDRSRFIYIGQRDHWHNRTARRNCDIVKAALEGCQWDISSFASCRDQRLK